MVERLGDRTLAHVTLGDGTRLVAEAHRESEVKAGDEVALTFDLAPVHLFDESGRAYHGQR